MLWFDEKSISNVHISGYILWHYVDCWKCQECFHSFVFLPSQDQKEERDIVCGGMHGDIYLQHQPICTSLGRWIITFHLATPQKTLNAIIGEKNGCHYGIVWSWNKLCPKSNIWKWVFAFGFTHKFLSS